MGKEQEATVCWCRRLWLGDLYGLNRALRLACKAFYAVLLSRRVRLFGGRWMAGRFSPVEQCHRADFDADAVAAASVPVDGHVGSMYAKLRRRLNRAPDIVTLMLSDNFSLLLKITVYRQNTSHRIKDLNCDSINPYDADPCRRRLACLGAKQRDDNGTRGTSTDSKRIKTGRALSHACPFR